MPGVLLDDGTWKAIAIPSVVTIGRSSGSDIQPDSQSVSKKHASLSLRLDHRGKLKCELTDFDSRNGTFYGPSPYDREMKRIQGTQVIEYGTYLKFGNGHTYFHFVEHQPVGTLLDYEGPHGPSGSVTAGIGQIDVRNSNSSGFRIGGDDVLDDSKPVLSNAASDKSLARSTSPELPLQAAYSANPPAQKRSQPTLHGDSDNMMISIQYPAGQTKPVSIHIDPQGHGPPQLNSNRNSYDMNSNRDSRDSRASHGSNMGGMGGPYDYEHRYGGSHGGGNERGQNNYDTNNHNNSKPNGSKGRVRGSLGTDQAWEDVIADRHDGSGGPANSQGHGQGALGHGVKRYNSQVDNSIDNDNANDDDYDGDNALPPMLGDAITGEADANVPNLASFRANAGNYHSLD